MSPVFSDGFKHESLPDKTIFDYADFLKIRVPTACSRNGSCHECIVHIKNGKDALSPLSESEDFLKEGYRLACQATVQDLDSVVEFSTLRRQPRILTKSISRDIESSPKVTIKNGRVFIDEIDSDRYRGKILGLSGDIGTTTVVLKIVDLENMKPLITSSFENPQRFGGSDVMNRISYDSGENQGELQNVLVAAINFEIGEMCKNISAHRRQIYDCVLVGNTTMRDILFGINVEPVGQKPYKSIIQTDFENGNRTNTSIEQSAETLGIRIFPKARVYSGPLISSHIGSDIAADLLTIQIDESNSNIMLVDVGTNTEVIIGNQNKMYASSCPAGPAFEGGEVKYGMPGYDGAVEKLEIINGSVISKTIGNQPAEGICGSGLVDLLAELRKSNLMNDLGVLSDNKQEFEFDSSRKMTISKADISSLAQAKSANYCGQYITLRKFGLPVDSIDYLYLAGGFANYINSQNAVDIGFIANFPPEKIKKVGNASLEGATLMLKSTKLRDRIEEICSKIQHVELETTPDFFEIFVEGCMFKAMPKNFTN